MPNPLAKETVLMPLQYKDAQTLFSLVDPGRVHAGQAVGLRDGALLALVCAGLTAEEIAGLQASAITTTGGRIYVEVDREGITWLAVLPTDLAARLIAWLSECRLWANPEPVFQGPNGPLTSTAVYQVLDRYRNRKAAKNCPDMAKTRRRIVI
jgi:site-specific recombinase XerC